jgi:hypothetical protein
LSYNYIITGFISNDAFLAGVSDLLQRARSLNPQLRYVCDPVLGDDGKCYCPPELIERFKQQLLPQAFIITPNAFEAQLLTGTRAAHRQKERHSSITRLLPGISIANASDAVRTLLALRRMGGSRCIPITVITSCELRATEECPPYRPQLHLFAMWGQDDVAADLNVCSIQIDKVDAALTGPTLTTTAPSFLPPFTFVPLIHISHRSLTLAIRHWGRLLLYFYRMG